MKRIKLVVVYKARGARQFYISPRDVLIYLYPFDTHLCAHVVQGGSRGWVSGVKQFYCNHDEHAC